MVIKKYIQRINNLLKRIKLNLRHYILYNFKIIKANNYIKNAMFLSAYCCKVKGSVANSIAKVRLNKSLDSIDWQPLGTNKQLQTFWWLIASKSPKDCLENIPKVPNYLEIIEFCKFQLGYQNYYKSFLCELYR